MKLLPIPSTDLMFAFSVEFFEKIQNNFFLIFSHNIFLAYEKAFFKWIMFYEWLEFVQNVLDWMNWKFELIN